MPGDVSRGTCREAGLWVQVAISLLFANQDAVGYEALSVCVCARACSFAARAFVRARARLLARLCACMLACVPVFVLCVRARASAFMRARV